MKPRKRLPGSSPLARGLPLMTEFTYWKLGIIPARAGFTCPTTRNSSLGKDHPRSRGVYVKSHWGKHYRSGSSPLARGLPLVLGQRGVGLRVSDHPRSRGVYRTGRCGERSPIGSSPLARGLLEHDGRPFDDAGIIPARAGFTLADPWNPNDEPPYQTSFAFTADLALAPQSSDSVVVSQRSTRTPSEA